MTRPNVGVGAPVRDARSVGTDGAVRDTRDRTNKREGEAKGDTQTDHGYALLPAQFPDRRHCGQPT